MAEEDMTFLCAMNAGLSAGRVVVPKGKQKLSLKKGKQKPIVAI